MNAPEFSQAYENPHRFYVVSYAEHNGNHELISETFTTKAYAKKWALDHQHEFEKELIVHTATLTGQVIEYTTEY